MTPEDLYKQDTYLTGWQHDSFDEDAIEELLADIAKYMEFWELAGRVAPRISIPRALIYDPATGLWVCQ